MDPSSSDPNIIFELAGITTGSTLGAAYLGILFASILYGITCCQTVNYYRSKKSRGDHWILKAMVAALWVLDTFHQGTLFHIGYHYLIIGYGNPLEIFSIVWSLSTEMLLNFIIGAIVQTFFIYRIWRFSDNFWISAFCGLWMLAALGYGIVYPIKTYIDPSMETAQHSFRKFTIGGSCLTLAGDLMLSLIMSFYLYHKRTGFRSTDGIITKLITMTVATGGLTASVWLASLLALILAPGTLYDLLLDPTISKLYANSALTMLNSRGFIGRPEAEPDNIVSEFKFNVHSSRDSTRTSTLHANVPGIDVIAPAVSERNNERLVDVKVSPDIV